jgi:hypothetical protein
MARARCANERDGCQLGGIHYPQYPVDLPLQATYRQEGEMTRTLARYARVTASVIGDQSEDDGERTRPRRHSMGDDLATSNVNRSYSLAATSIAIFTFMLFFLYPKFASGEINAMLFQATLVVMGVATFSFVFASFYYYCSSLGSRIDDAERALYSRRGDRFWLLGDSLLFLDPSLILFSVGLLAVGSAWFALWLVYLLFVIRHFPTVQTARKSSSRGEARAD